MPSPPTISIPDIREYDRINAELVRLLDQGSPVVLLAGAERQRLLAFGLRGGWRARVVIDGLCGPEVGAELDAPGLSIICRGSTGDGAGRSLRSGRLLVFGSSGDAVGASQSGGRILANRGVGHRAGLRQSGGDLIVLGEVGRLACERRSGGRFFASRERLGAFFEHGASGGEFVPLDPRESIAIPPLDALLSLDDDPFDGFAVPI
ncbi:MAG: glutamate synthase [Isosphaeraceae bacterium]|nr:glutamate synthase [Isosphaeraceae bacterium]